MIPIARPARRRARRFRRAGFRGGPLRRLLRRLSGGLAALLVALALVVVPTTGARVHADDGELQPRLAAACARVPEATTRLQAAIARLDGPADQRGSLAWFDAAVTKAESRNRPRIAADLQRRLDRLTQRRATLDVRQEQLERFTQRCADLEQAG